MNKIQITAQYIELERTNNGAIDAHFQTTSELSTNTTTIIIRKEKKCTKLHCLRDRQCDTHKKSKYNSCEFVIAN